MDLTPLLKNEKGVPVLLVHDANAGAMKEWLMDETVYLSDKTICYYLIGEGVGAGIINGGEILLGEQGMACEVGHISVDPFGERCRCGNYGCLELYCSSLSIVDQANNLLYKFPNSSLNGKEIELEDIFSACREGDELAGRIVDKLAFYIAIGAVNIIRAYDPIKITIGDKIAKGGDLLEDKVKDIIYERTKNTLDENFELVFEDADEDYILDGAACLAIDYFLRNFEILKKMEEKHEKN